ncbi:hypothetical protein pb186bvf_001988 [Paramecium bursaria]
MIDVIEDDIDYKQDQLTEVEDITSLVEKERIYGDELKIKLGQKNKEYIDLTIQLKQVIDSIWEIKHEQYNQNALVDPFLTKYLRDLLDTIDDTNYQSNQDQEKTTKKEELNRHYQTYSGTLKTLRTQNEIQSHLQIAHRNMMESLNQEIFQQMQERADLEDQQFEFDKKFKSLREQIREVAEKNQKLIKQIESQKVE